MAKRSKSREIVPAQPAEYVGLVSGISELLDRARRSAARCVNSIMTPTYWEIGRRIVEYEQRGLARAEYGKEVLKRLSQDLTARHGRGFSKRNVEQMRPSTWAGRLRRHRLRNWWCERNYPRDGGGARHFQTPSGELEARAKFPTASENWPRYRSVQGQLRRHRLRNWPLPCLPSCFPSPGHITRI